MSSVTYTGTCCLPLWTAMVKPTNSGKIVERRDQVLIGRLSFASRAASTFFNRCRSMKGPFFKERGTAFTSMWSFTWLNDDVLSFCQYACSYESYALWSEHPKE